MRNNRHQDRQRVRIDLKKKTLNSASNLAAGNGETLSAYVERLVETDLATAKRERWKEDRREVP
jgi:hypothetical protein